MEILITKLKVDIKKFKASQKKTQEKSSKTCQTDESTGIFTSNTVETQTNMTEVSDKTTETLLCNLDLEPDIEHIFSGFCKETLRQLGKTDLVTSHLRLLVYKGDEDDIVATSDYYADYAKALDIMMESRRTGE